MKSQETLIDRMKGICQVAFLKDFSVMLLRRSEPSIPPWQFPSTNTHPTRQSALYRYVQNQR